MDKISNLLGLIPELQKPDIPPISEAEEQERQREAQYETSLAEFPIFLLCKKPPADLDCLIYNDTITVKDVPVERKWKVSWSKKYGPGTQSTAATFFALFQFWADTDFSSPWIHFKSINNLLERRGLTKGVDNYTRILRDLLCLCNIFIEAENALYDKDKKKYIDASFHLFEGTWLEKESKGNPDPSSRGFIKASDTLFSSVQKNIFFLGINEQEFFKLPGLQQRLFLYLRKMFIFQKFHVRNIQDLARQIPLFATPKFKLKQELKQAVEGLMDAGILPTLGGYKFFPSEVSGNDLIRFDRVDSRQLGLFKEEPIAIQARNEENEYRFSLITDVLKDTHSYPFYRKVAAVLDTDDICRALSESKETARDATRTGRKCHIAKVFTSRVQMIASKRGISL